MVYRFCNFFQVSIAINPANGHKSSCKAEKTLSEKHHIKRWKRHETALKIPDKQKVCFCGLQILIFHGGRLQIPRHHIAATDLQSGAIELRISESASPKGLS